jgi:hypothetical protein
MTPKILVFAKNLHKLRKKAYRDSQISEAYFMNPKGHSKLLFATPKKHIQMR